MMTPSMRVGKVGLLPRLASYFLRNHDAGEVDRRLVSVWLAEKAAARVISLAVAEATVYLFLLPVATIILRQWIGADSLWSWYAIYLVLFASSSYLLGHASASILERTLVRGGWGVQRDGKDDSSGAAPQ